MNSELVMAVRMQIAKIEVAIKIITNTRETSLAFTQIQNARIMCGILLGELGSESPYAIKDGKRENLDDILPSAIDWSKFEQAVEDERDLFNGKDPVPRIKYCDQLRESIKGVANEVKTWAPAGPIREAYFSAILTSLSLSRSWLGEELARIREGADRLQG